MTFKWRGPEVEDAIKWAAMDAMTTGMEAIMSKASQAAPIRTGTLRRSKSVTRVNSELAIYGSFNTPYARRQHEDLYFRHPRGGGPKFLENPFQQSVAMVVELVNNKVKIRLRGGK